VVLKSRRRGGAGGGGGEEELGGRRPKRRSRVQRGLGRGDAVEGEQEEGWKVKLTHTTIDCT